MIRNRNFSFWLDSKSMTEYAYGLLNNVYTLKIPIKNSKDKVKLSFTVHNIFSNDVKTIEAEIEKE